MKNLIFLLILVLSLFSCNSQVEQKKAVPKQADSVNTQALKKIDVHAHFRYKRDYFPAFLEKWNMQGVLIDVAIEKNATITRSWDEYTVLAKSYPASFFLCSSLIGTNIDNPDFAATEIIRLSKEIKEGAKMVKVWKNFGMVTKDNSGNFIQIDDVRLQPIWDFLKDNGIPVIAHIGEPLQAWRPLDDPKNPHYGYYSDHPEYHAYKHPEIPSYESIIMSRDRWIENNPDLQILCAHMGSMSHDVNMVAERLDKFPNMYVEPAARFGDLAGQDSKKVKVFFEKYQDRVFFGTDFGNHIHQDSLTSEEIKEEYRDLDESYNRLWKYLSSSDSLVIRNQKTQGLELPMSVLQKVYYQNVVNFLDLE